MKVLDVFDKNKRGRLESKIEMASFYRLGSSLIFQKCPGI